MKMRGFGTAMVMTALALSSCQCGPTAAAPDAGEEEPVVPMKRDSGVIVLPPDPPTMVWPTTFASEPCPREAFGLAADGGFSGSDAGLRFGICIALRTLTADAFLDGVRETRPVNV